MDYFLIVVPVAVALFGWIALVFWANWHPEMRRVRNPPRSVAGGTFQGGGRAVMPTRDAVPPEAMPQQGGPQESEAQQAGPQQAGPWTMPAQGSAPDADSRQAQAARSASAHDRGR